MKLLHDAQRDQIGGFGIMLAATPRRRDTVLRQLKEIDMLRIGWRHREQHRSKPLPAQDFLHRLPPRQFVDQLVEIAQLAHQRVFDRLDADPANHPGD